MGGSTKVLASEINWCWLSQVQEYVISFIPSVIPEISIGIGLSKKRRSLAWKPSSWPADGCAGIFWAENSVTYSMPKNDKLPCYYFSFLLINQVSFPYKFSLQLGHILWEKT